VKNNDFFAFFFQCLANTLGTGFGSAQVDKNTSGLSDEASGRTRRSITARAPEPLLKILLLIRFYPERLQTEWSIKISLVPTNARVSEAKFRYSR
jgi:hypothetical protein